MATIPSVSKWRDTAIGHFVVTLVVTAVLSALGYFVKHATAVGVSGSVVAAVKLVLDVISPSVETL